MNTSKYFAANFNVDEQEDGTLVTKLYNEKEFTSHEEALHFAGKEVNLDSDTYSEEEISFNGNLIVELQSGDGNDFVIFNEADKEEAKAFVRRNF